MLARPSRHKGLTVVAGQEAVIALLLVATGRDAAVVILELRVVGPPIALVTLKINRKLAACKTERCESPTPAPLTLPRPDEVAQKLLAGQQPVRVFVRGRL